VPLNRNKQQKFTLPRMLKGDMVRIADQKQREAPIGARRSFSVEAGFWEKPLTPADGGDLPLSRTIFGHKTIHLRRAQLCVASHMRPAAAGKRTRAHDDMEFQEVAMTMMTRLRAWKAVRNRLVIGVHTVPYIRNYVV
jgi:hypothetical protein